MAIPIVINPQSGKGLGRRLARDLGRYDPIILDPGRIAEQLERRVRPGDTVIIAGGDGTASMVIEALFRLDLGGDVRAVLYPLGTGNDLARSLGARLPADPVGFVETFAPERAAWREVAVWKMGRRYFVNYVGLGVDAQILAAADRWRRFFPARPGLRKFSLGCTGLWHQFYRIRQDVYLKTDTAVLPLKGAAGVILSNIGYVVGGSRIGELEPAASRLSVTVLQSSYDLLRIYFSRYGPQRAVRPYTLAHEVAVEGGALPLEIDGEVALFEPGVIACAGTLRFLLPPVATSGA